MYFLIFIFFGLISIVILLGWHKKKLQGVEANCQALGKQHESILKEARELERQNNTVSKNVRNLVELYEITKNLTKSLDLEEIFAIFRQLLKDKTSVQDCRLLRPGEDLTALENYGIFPLKTENELIGHICIKGLHTQDWDKFYILLNQFTLVLKRVGLYAKIEELSITDSLTGLYLRRFFQERMDEEISRSKKYGLEFGLLMLDLDNFKSYNDRYGHLVGDVLLSAVAGVIRDNTRQIDIAARYGGEEFSIILPDVSREEADFIGVRLCKAVASEKIHAYDETLRMTVSIGGSFFPRDATETQLLIDKADRALYKAKQSGKNSFFFWQE